MPLGYSKKSLTSAPKQGELDGHRRRCWWCTHIVHGFDFLYILPCHPFHIRQLLRVLNGTPAHTRATSKQGVNWSWTIVGPKKGIERYCYWKSIESLLCPSCLWIFVDASFTLQASASDLVTVHLLLYNFLFFPGCPPSLIAIAEMVSGCFMDFAFELEPLQPLQAMLQFP